MSLSSTSNLKGQLIKNLGANAKIYFDALSNFVSGRTSREEFELVTKEVLISAHLLQLHNAMIISLFDATATLKRPPSPPPPALPKPPPSKRRRTLLPYQGPDTADDERAIRTARLKKWALSIGPKERERIKAMESASVTEHPRPRKDLDEISCERGIEFLVERGDPPGSRLPIQLHANTRAPTLQHTADRVNLISAQHNFAAPARSVPVYLTLATEAFLKQLITHAITLTLSSSTISSISPSSQNNSSHHYHLPKAQVLSAASMHALFTISPAELPGKSAAAVRFGAFSGNLEDETEDIGLLKDREVRDQRWQIMALLAERSTIRDNLKNKPR